jgi:hypothetical protein
MKLNYLQIQIMHGLLLGDGHIYKKNNNNNPSFTQTFGQHSELFAKYVYENFKEFCTPKGFYSYKVQSGLNSPFYQRFIVRTRSLIVFQEFYDMYYITNNLGKNIKKLPLDIENLLTPIILANFVMSDGNYHKTKHIIRLCTNNFTKEEVQSLSTAILKKYNIKNSLEHVRKEQYIIRIRKTEVYKLQDIVKPHIIPSMLYRIGL